MRHHAKRRGLVLVGQPAHGQVLRRMLASRREPDHAPMVAVLAHLACEGLYSPATIACSVCGHFVDGGDPKQGYVRIRNAEPPYQLLGRVCSVECGRSLEADADHLLALPEARSYPYGGREGLASV